MVEVERRGLYPVNGFLHLERIHNLSNVISSKQKTKTEWKNHHTRNKVGKSLKNLNVKDLVSVRTRKQT
jgi:hypothetical protein